MKKKEIKVNLGCGVHLFKDWINVDKFINLKDLKEKKGIYEKAIIEKGAEFVKADICDLPFKDNFANKVECIETIEHIPFNKILKAFAEIRRILKPGGRVLITTVNFDEIAKLWVEHIISQPLDWRNWMVLLGGIYGNQLTEGEFHACPFNPEFMKWCLDQTGFKSYEIIIHPSGSRYPELWSRPLSKKLNCMIEMIVVRARK